MFCGVGAGERRFGFFFLAMAAVAMSAQPRSIQNCAWAAYLIS